MLIEGLAGRLIIRGKESSVNLAPHSKTAIVFTFTIGMFGGYLIKRDDADNGIAYHARCLAIVIKYYAITACGWNLVIAGVGDKRTGGCGLNALKRKLSKLIACSAASAEGPSLVGIGGRVQLAVFFPHYSRP